MVGIYCPLQVVFTDVSLLHKLVLISFQLWHHGVAYFNNVLYNSYVNGENMLLLSYSYMFSGNKPGTTDHLCVCCWTCLLTEQILFALQLILMDVKIAGITELNVCLDRWY